MYVILTNVGQSFCRQQYLGGHDLVLCSRFHRDLQRHLRVHLGSYYRSHSAHQIVTEENCRRIPGRILQHGHLRRVVGHVLHAVSIHDLPRTRPWCECLRRSRALHTKPRLHLARLGNSGPSERNSLHFGQYRISQGNIISCSTDSLTSGDFVVWPKSLMSNARLKPEAKKPPKGATSEAKQERKKR